MSPGDRVVLIKDPSTRGTLLSRIGAEKVRVMFDGQSFAAYTFIDRLRPMNAIERLADLT